MGIFIIMFHIILYGVIMEIVVTTDRRGRILIPKKVRGKLGISGKSMFLLRIREDDVIELIPLNKLYKDVSEIFENKFKGWKEEDHEASKILSGLIK